MEDKKIKEMIYTSMLAALICVATFIIKVPLPVTNGYTHLGDGFIFIAVLLLGRRNGAWAGAIGAALADIIGGYSFYAIPTFIIKGIMAFIMGTIVERGHTFLGDSQCSKSEGISPIVTPNSSKYKWVMGAVLGSIWQVFGYYVAGSLMIGNFIATISEIPGNTIQSIAGIIAAAAFMTVIKHTPIGKNSLEC